LLPSFVALLAPYPGRLEFAARIGLTCALTVLVVEIYQTPDPALTAYLVFFAIKPDRTTSVVISIVLIVLMTLIIGGTLLIAMAVVDYPFWRVTAMSTLSFCLLFAAAGSKLKPVAAIIALIAGYALDLLGSIQIGEIATRALLYAWLFVGIPAGLTIAVNLVLGPEPRRLVEKELARRLRLAAAMLLQPDARTRGAFSSCLREGPGEVPEWLKAAGMDKTSPSRDIAALKQASQSTAAIVSMIDVVSADPDRLLPDPYRERLVRILDDMAAILERGGYPIDIVFDTTPEPANPSPLSVAIIAELQGVLGSFAAVPPPDPSPASKPKEAGGFFLPDAFSNPEYVQYAIKTTAAAMFCYFVYLMLDWPGIHTCLITCYIVSLGTTAETLEKLTLRILGCLIGAGTGIAAIVFLMPHVTSIGALMAIVFLVALVSGWIAAGGPRISYIGFQVAFAFFLCVVQGASPAFDMTVARDRVIGIIFGNLVVALIFTQIWPVSVAQRIDPAIETLLRRLAGMAAAGSREKRRELAAETQEAFAPVEQDLNLALYEPSSIRPDRAWMVRRRQIADAVASLQGPLLVFDDQDSSESGDIRRRLDRVAEEFGVRTGLESAVAGSTTLTSPAREPQPAAASEIRALVEPPLATLERAVAGPLVDEQEEKASYALA
jgi:multidrug resistance protein MdtO